MVLTNLSIAHYATVSVRTAVFILGGQADWANTSKIARFQSGLWTDIGNLKFQRQGHRALKYGTRIMIVGGMATADR